MRLLLIVFSFLIFSQLAFGQVNDSTEAVKNRLFWEISSSYKVQSKYIGCYSYLSQLYQKVDTLKTIVGLKSFTNYFRDSSVNLKYYAFIEILGLDDNLAFEKLKSISQCSDSINFEFAGQFRGKVSLIDLLTGEYLRFINMKYYYGGVFTIHGRSYSFGEKSKRAWRQKKIIAYEFLIANSLSMEWIENYYR